MKIYTSASIRMRPPAWLPYQDAEGKDERAPSVRSMKSRTANEQA